MVHVQQVLEWRTTINEFFQHPASKTLEPDARWFLEMFLGLLMKQSIEGRANVSSPFTAAVKHLIERRGFTIDRPCVAVQIAPGLAKQADVSFSTLAEQWIIEIKLNLDFTSLACAALQGASYKANHSAHKQMLFSLYAKQISGDVVDALKVCGLAHAFDHICVLSRNSLYKKIDSWSEDFAQQLNVFVRALPMAINA